MPYMYITELVSHAKMSWLNDVAPSNICSMLVTELVFHKEMSALKFEAPSNMAHMSVTELTSQELMLHATPVSSILSRQSSTAAFRAFLVVYVFASAPQTNEKTTSTTKCFMTGIEAKN